MESELLAKLTQNYVDANRGSVDFDFDRLVITSKIKIIK
jgi:hypothetical protein